LPILSFAEEKGTMTPTVKDCFPCVMSLGKKKGTGMNFKNTIGLYRNDAIMSETRTFSTKTSKVESGNNNVRINIFH
jgi:hypothetical protein